MLCASCARGHYVGPSGACVACSGGAAGSAVVLVLCLVLLVAGLGWMIRAEVRAVGAGLGDGEVLKKVLINHAQLIGMCTGLRMEWPSPGDGLLAASDAAASMGELFVAPECLSSRGSSGTAQGRLGGVSGMPAPLWRVLLVALLPLGLLGAVGLLGLLRVAVVRRWPPYAQVRLWGCASVVAVLYVLYSPLTRAVLRLFACRTVGVGPAA